MTDTSLDTAPVGMSEALAEVIGVPYEDTDDGQERLTHIVNPPNNLHIFQPGMTSREIVDIARATGQEVVALCGKRWVPKRNPDKYPACRTCVDIAGQIMRAKGE